MTTLIAALASAERGDPLALRRAVDAMGTALEFLRGSLPSDGATTTGNRDADHDGATPQGVSATTSGDTVFADTGERSLAASHCDVADAQFRHEVAKILARGAEAWAMDPDVHALRVLLTRVLSAIERGVNTPSSTAAIADAR